MNFSRETFKEVQPDSAKKRKESGPGQEIRLGGIFEESPDIVLSPLFVHGLYG